MAGSSFGDNVNSVFVSPFSVSPTDGGMLNNGVEQTLPPTAINLSDLGDTGKEKTIKDEEAQRIQQWNKSLSDTTTNAQQIINETHSGWRQASTEINNLAAQLIADQQQLTTLLAGGSFAHAAVTQLRNKIKQEGQDITNLYQDQMLFAQAMGDKLNALSFQPGPTGSTGPTGPTGPAAGPTGPTASPTGPSPTGAGPPVSNSPVTGPVGPAGTGQTLTGAYYPNGNASQANESGYPMMMPMGGMGGGMPLGGLNGLGTQPDTSGLSGPQGNNAQAGNTTGSTGPKAQEVAASTTAKPGGGMKAPGADAPTMTASSLRSVGNSVPAGPNTDVKLPDGTTTPASATRRASAAQAAQNGASPADASQQAAMSLPPLGALGLHSGRGGGRADQRRQGLERLSGDDDQDGDRTRRE